jgi:hypothetical protein
MQWPTSVPPRDRLRSLHHGRRTHVGRSPKAAKSRFRRPSSLTLQVHSTLQSLGRGPFQHQSRQALEQPIRPCSRLSEPLCRMRVKDLLWRCSSQHHPHGHYHDQCSSLPTSVQHPYLMITAPRLSSELNGQLRLPGWREELGGLLTCRTGGYWKTRHCGKDCSLSGPGRNEDCTSTRLSDDCTVNCVARSRCCNCSPTLLSII